MALDLAAGSLGQRRGPQQDDGGGRHLVLVGDGAADRRDDAGDLCLVVLAVLAMHLRHHRQPLLALPLDREGGNAARTQGRMAALDGELDVLRVVVAAAEDDEVLQPAGDEQLALGGESEIAGPQEGAAAIAQSRGEHPLGFLRLAPVALGDARPLHPDFSHLARRAGLRGVGAHDGDHRVAGLRVRRQAAADQRPRSGIFGGDRAAEAPARGHQKRGLGQSVTRVERFAAEAAGGKSGGEAVQGVGADGLGAVEGQAPARQVEVLLLLLGDLADAEVVGEVGAAAGGGAGVGDGPQPAHRLLEERQRRQQRHRITGVERLQDAADEPHVMVRRQPDDRPLALGLGEAGADQLQVVQQVGVGKPDAFGGGGRARGVLQEGERGRLDAWIAPVVQEGVEVRGARHRLRRIVGDQPFGAARHLQNAFELGPQRRRGENDPRRCVLDDRAHPRRRPVGARRIGRHRRGAAVEAAEKRGDVVDPGRVEQQRPLARGAQALQGGAKAPRPPVELGVGKIGFGPVAVAQKAVAGALRLPAGPQAQQFHQGRGRSLIRFHVFGIRLHVFLVPPPVLEVTCWSPVGVTTAQRAVIPQPGHRPGYVALTRPSGKLLGFRPYTWTWKALLRHLLETRAQTL